jgi:hypothetical protein
MDWFASSRPVSGQTGTGLADTGMTTSARQIGPSWRPAHATTLLATNWP